MLKKIGIFLIVIICWAALGAFVFKPSVTDRYFVEPYGVSKYTDRNNGVTPKKMALAVPITLGTRRYAIPSAYLARIGPWDPATKSFGGQVFMAASGTDFKPIPGALADNESNSVSIWIDLKTAPPHPDIIKPPPPKVLPATRAEFEAGVRKNPTFWLRDGMARATDLDRFGLLAYRDSFWGETYVGTREHGGILVIHCQAPEKAALPVCEVFDARYPEPTLNVKYAFLRTYLEQWRHFDTGVNGLLAQFERR